MIMEMNGMGVINDNGNEWSFHFNMTNEIAQDFSKSKC